jgi:ferredoxin
MEAAKFLSDAALRPWLDELATKHALVVPRREGDAIVFAPYDPAKPLDLSRDATIPPKNPVFPACEELMRYSYAKNPENPAQAGLTLEPLVPMGSTVVFGGRPCGARGFTIFDRVYLTQRIRDPYYGARRESTAYVTLACSDTGNTCFCHWVGSSPSDTTGSDVLLTPVAGGYVAEAVTEKGSDLLKSTHMADAGGREKEALAAKSKALEALEAAPDLGPAPKSLLAVFDDQDFWVDMSAKCISCGACTYLCPTCYCFNITDEVRGLDGSRLRTWDNCMSHQYTMEASGHNPRPTKAHRLKNRVGHKFSYYPDIHGGVIACCGCGRCIKSCPVGVDIREIVLASIERATAKPQE